MDSQKRRQYSRYRSGNNSSYRRRQEQEPVDIRETILSQCVISGFILLSALIVCFVNLPTTNNLRASLKQAITQETTTEHINELIVGIIDSADGVKNSVRSLFGENPEESEDFSFGDDGGAELLHSVESPTPTPSANPTTEVRIDEDILQQLLDNQKDIDTAEKKRTAPTL